MIEIGKISASVSQSAKDLVPSIPATGLTSNHLRLNFARQVGTFAMVIFLVMAILVTIKNQLTNKGQTPRLTTPGAQDLSSLETNDIENILDTKDRKQQLGMDSPEEQALLSDPQNEATPQRRRIDFSLVSGLIRNQNSSEANQNINGIQSYFHNKEDDIVFDYLNDSQSSGYSATNLSSAMMSDSFSESDYRPRNSYNSQRSQSLNKKYEIDNKFDEPQQLYLDIEEDEKIYNSYSIKEQELFQQDAVPPVGNKEAPNGEVAEKQTPRPPMVPIHKQIPKIALNFTKWKLQQNMVTDLRSITDQSEVAKKLSKYTECFDLLDRLGADNCVDPEDFDQEDLDDELFKNLQITDIEELFKEEKAQSFISMNSDNLGRHESKIEQDTPHLGWSGLDGNILKGLDSISEKGKISDEEPLIIDQESDALDDGDLSFMDFDQQMQMYEKMEREEQESDDEFQSTHNKFKIQGLEEVLEQSEESDQTSSVSYISAGGFSSASSASSADSETADRIRMAEDLKELDELTKQTFKFAPIPFKFDFEDYENCKLNGELKRLIAQQQIKIPIVPYKNTPEYLLGTRKVTLLWQKRSVYVQCPNSENVLFTEYIEMNNSCFQKQLCFYVKKSNWTIEKVVQALYDDKPIENITKRNVKLLKSYTEMITVSRSSGASKRATSSNRATPGSNVRSPAGKTPGEGGTPSPNKCNGEVDSSKVNFILTPNGKNLRIETKNTPTGDNPIGDFLQIPNCNQSFERPSSYMSL